MKEKPTRKQRKHTNVADRSQVMSLIRETVNHMLSKIATAETSGTVVATTNGGEPLVFSDNSFQSLVARLRPVLSHPNHSSFERLIVSEILLCAEKIERQYHGTGMLFAKTFLRTLKRSVDMCAVPSRNNKDITSLFNRLRSGMAEQHIGVPSVVMSNTGKLRPGRILTPTVCHALNVAGLLGTVSVEKYHDSAGSAESIIERSSGHRFRVDVMSTFLGSLSIGEFGVWDRAEVRVLIVDGVMNTVAEIDKILLGATNTKQPLLVMASYFEEEVVATVAANNLAGNCDVFLALLPRDSLEGVNMANDIATCCLSTPINPHVGHGMLSFLEHGSLASVERVRVILATKTLEITNRKAHGAVAIQIAGLQEKLQQLSCADSDDKVKDASSELLNKRITNLLSDRVVIKVPDTSANILLPAIDNQIRQVKSLLQHGQLINTTRFRQWFCESVATSAELNRLLSITAKELIGELRECARRKEVVVGVAPYAVLWLAYSLAVQYLNTDCAVLTVS